MCKKMKKMSVYKITMEICYAKVAVFWTVFFNEF